MATWQVPFPSWQTIAGQVALFFIFEDAFHFFAHQALHWGPLYKHIHKIHHKYSAPFGLAAEYAHPAEVLYEVHTSFRAHTSSSLSSRAVLRMRRNDARSVAAVCSELWISCCTA